MTITEALISGIVQGVTEFLPVSSSGHLVIVHRLFGLSEEGMFFDICLHVATVMAIIIYFRKDLIRLFRERRIDWLWFIGIGTMPAVLAGSFLGGWITRSYGNAVNAGLMLIVTAAFLLLGHICLRRKTLDKRLNKRNSLVIGLAQAISLLPGVSRSGATISTALMAGVGKEQAFRFSFLLAIPAVLGAVSYKLMIIDSVVRSRAMLLNYAVGFSAAFVFGYLSLSVLWKSMVRKRLIFFAIYCFILGSVILLIY